MFSFVPALNRMNDFERSHWVRFSRETVSADAPSPSWISLYPSLKLPRFTFVWNKISRKCRTITARRGIVKVILKCTADNWIWYSWKTRNFVRKLHLGNTVAPPTRLILGRWRLHQPSPHSEWNITARKSCPAASRAPFRHSNYKISPTTSP